MQNIRFVKHHNIDKSKWDFCIDMASNGLIYAYSFYLDEVSKNWDALIMNDYEAVMPLTWNRKFGISYLRQPAFTQQLGVFANAKIDHHLLEQFICKASEHFPFIEINLNFANEFNKNVEKKTNFIIPLNQSFPIIKESFRKDLVKKATDANLVYEPSENVEEAIRLFKNSYSKRLPNLHENDYKNFLNLCSFLKKKGQVIIRKVKSADAKLLAIAIFFKDEKRIYYLLSTLLDEGRKYDANAFLLHEVIKEFSGQNLLFDFEGSDIPSIKFFFKKFNPLDQPYFFLRINTLPFWKKWIKNIYDYYKQSCLKESIFRRSFMRKK